MTDLVERLKALVALEKDATPGPWVWQNGSSWWRLASEATRRDGDVICPVVDQYDRHPNLSFKNGDVDRNLIVALRNSIEDIQHAADEIVRLRKALQAIGDGDVPRPVGEPWAKDGAPSKLDKCTHGRRMNEDCDQCIEEFARQALSGDTP